jgi:RecA-family ATPase
VLDRFPLRNVSLLSGEGAVGKTILLQQLAVAHVLARGWLDTLPEPGPAIYLNAEDEEDELFRRYADVARLYESSFADLKNDLHLLAFAGKDAVLAHADRGGLVQPTPLFQQLSEAACDIKPKLVVLDTSADIFAGNENDRSQVRQFVGLLRRIAMAANCAVIVAFHPSLTGISTGTGMSGSTAWHNSVRARAYLRSVTTEKGEEPDTSLRQLDFMKSNYSALADSITLRWKNGVYIPEPKLGSLEKLAADAKADNVFLDLLAKYTASGRRLSDSKNSTNYAPRLFVAEPAAKGLSLHALENAMRRLFEAKKIRSEEYGRPSNRSSRLLWVPHEA